MNPEEIKRKLKVMYKLAEEGTEGEKQAALMRIEKIQNKYGDTYDLESIYEELKERYFNIESEVYRKLFHQIVYMVIGDCEIYVFKDKRKNQNILSVEATEFEKDQIDFLFSFYKDKYKNELKLFHSAFCLKQNLYPDTSARLFKPTAEESNELSKERMREIEKIQSYSHSIEKYFPIIGIENN